MSITHSTGWARTINIAVVRATLAFSIIAFAMLAALALRQPLNGVAVGGVIFSLSMMLCATCSYFYTKRLHTADAPLWRQLDHAAIFLLIAGTYTPFVTHIAGPFGLGLIYWTWGLAIFGIAARLLIRRGGSRLFIILYVAIGWLFLTALTEILATTNTVSLLFLGAGAVSYTVGALLFARDIGRWTDPVWHGFVLGGCYLHFLAVLVLAINNSY